MTDREKQLLLECMRANIGDATHAEDHIFRVTSAARDIARTEKGVDEEALFCACLLHDIGRGEQLADPSRPHAEVGAEKARAFLIENGWSEAFAARVSQIIAAHSSREMAADGGIEEKILFDADKLDMIGSVGLCRAIAYAVQAGEPIYDARDLAQKPSPDGGTMLREVENDLAFASGAFFTRHAQTLARPALQLTFAFLENLREVMERGSGAWLTADEAEAERPFGSLAE